MHLNDDRIQRLIDGELTVADERSARAHVAECASCRERVDAADDASAVSTLLMALDGPTPAIPFERIEVRARTRRPMPWTRSAIGWAAAVVVAVAAVAAPGSPVPGWVGGAVRWVSGASPPATAPAPAPEADGAGIAVDPGASFVIEIQDRGVGGTVIVLWTDDDRVAVRSSLAGTAFTSSTDRLVVAIDRDSVTLEVAVPRTAPRVEIRAGDRILWLGQEGRISVPSTPGPDGAYRISIDPR
jgi:hypothetical protein